MSSCHTAVFCASVWRCTSPRLLAATCHVSPTVPRRTFLARHVRTRLYELNRRRKKMQEQSPQPVPRRSSFLEWNYTAELKAFSARLGEELDEELLRVVFTDLSYTTRERSHEPLSLDGELQQRQQNRDDERLRLIEREIGAQTHTERPEETAASQKSSASQQMCVTVPHADNSQLALRGGAVTRIFTSGWLRAAAPLVPEEGVQEVTSHLCSDQQMAALAEGLGVVDLLLCSQYPPPTSALAGCVRAFVGALDTSAVSSDGVGGDLTQAERFTRDFVVAPVCTAADWHIMWPMEEPERVLAQCVRRCGRRSAPEPRLMRHAAPSTILAAFHVGFFLDGQLLGSAPGSSVEEARRLAARDSLDRLMGLHAACFNVRRPISPQHSPATSLDEWRPFEKRAH